MKTFFILPLFAVLFINTNLAFANNLSVLLSKNENISSQQSGITLSAANIKQPHLLIISGDGSKLTGEVKIDNKLLKKINTNNPDSINLSPYLSPGKHTVKISGNYAPSSAVVKIELNGPGVSVVQQNSGNGGLDYTLLIYVQ